MRKRHVLALAATMLAGAAVFAGFAIGGNGATDDHTFDYSIGLWGDLPYSSQQEAALPNLIADMNRQQLAFTVHDGDLKAGSGPCPDSLYQKALGWFNSFDTPAMFTTGDNDWTDCDRNAGVSSLERLDYERKVFFSTDRSLGRHPLRQEVQTDPLCLYQDPASTGQPIQKGPCVENRRWTYKGVTYATLNVQGSCNNLCDVNPDHDEWAARNAADIAWLDSTFAEAKAQGSAAVMIFSQADPGWDDTDATRAPTRNPETLAEDDADSGPLDGFQSLLLDLRAKTIDFGKPVAWVHGDSHYFRIDKPLLDANGLRVENFTRVETFGDHAGNAASDTNEVQWVKALVDPRSRDVFAFEPEIVPANAAALTP